MKSKYARIQYEEIPSIHPEKCFVESTKILLNQQKFGWPNKVFRFKYESMEIFVDSTKHFSGCTVPARS